jgi:hypothetical protein
MVASFRLVLDNVDDEETVYEESYITDTELSAEKRLGDLWNKYCAHMPDRGYRARLFHPGSDKPDMTIEG